MKFLLDSNILIYSGIISQTGLRTWLSSRSLFISHITKLEVLGYHKLSNEEFSYFNNFIDLTTILPISDITVEAAIHLRQQKSMSLGDCLVAATALQYNIPLATANQKDFKHIEKLKLINPLVL